MRCQQRGNSRGVLKRQIDHNQLLLQRRWLQANGVIELFAAVINPEKLGQVNSTFLDIVVAPVAVERIAQELADCPEVVSLYIMSDLKSLHVHALTESPETFEAFVRRHIFNRPEILSVDCKTLLTRVKNRRGGARL
mgnify:CR=1 FL=1